MSSKKRKLKIGVFGAGRGFTMIKGLANNPDAELSAICDYYPAYEERAKKLISDAGVKTSFYTDFDKFMNHDMDAVVLANYANEHVPYALRLLKSGRHIMSEVLACQTMAEAVQLIEAVEASKKVYSYAENYCYFRSTQEMKRIYKAGDIGEFTHGEGEYVHDCEPIWPSITYGDKNHWRNNMYSTFYCTHSLGPIMTITGTRPERVVGFEGRLEPKYAALGLKGAPHGMEVIKMSNGATVKSLHGSLKREPHAVWYSIYGNKGMMESDRFGETFHKINVYKEGSKTSPNEVSYKPRFPVENAQSRAAAGHGGSDYYTLHSFIEKILGRSYGSEAIDVYTAVDMTIAGLLAYRSICNGNIPIEVPDFRIKKNRDPFRNDNWCTDPKVAGKDKAPCAFPKESVIPDATYKKVAKHWESIKREWLGL
ncbi:MAG: Gfo/Idh/MocA family oxidoreductase [Fibrobacteres bacterium]|nr:Gfo/Idh/MocA family oxidoreductase [Fibrobacterota bacterium]